MTAVIAERIISMGHRLESYDGICSSPHGHNVRVVATVDTRGAFVDFKLLDRALGAVLEDLDHAMVLRESDPLLAALRSFSGFRTVGLSVEPTTEALAHLVFNELLLLQYVVARVDVYETAKYAASATARKEGVLRCSVTR